MIPDSIRSYLERYDFEGFDAPAQHIRDHWDPNEPVPTRTYAVKVNDREYTLRVEGNPYEGVSMFGHTIADHDGERATVAFVETGVETDVVFDTKSSVKPVLHAAAMHVYDNHR